MKRFLGVLLVPILVAVVFACNTSDPFVIDNGVHNIMSVSPSGITGTSQMTSYNAPDDALNLGTVTLITGPLTGGSLVSTKLMVGGTFSSTGSTFKIVGNGTNGAPEGAIFTGTFTGTLKWYLTNTIWNTYALTGTVKGKFVYHDDTQTVTGTVAQCFVYDGASFTLVGGVTNLKFNGGE